MTEPVDWAPYASDGEEFRILPPMGMSYCLTTDDIFKARPSPSIRRYLHGQIYEKVEMLPLVCRTFDPNNTKQITYSDFGRSLAQFGINLSEKELREVLGYADKEHFGSVRYNKFAKVLRSLDNWEKPIPQRLGAELGCPPTNANLGQGVQVLVDFKPKVRSSHVREGSNQIFPYDLFTGEPLEGGQSTILNRDPLSFSYAERAAALSKQKHQMGIANLLYPIPQRLAPIKSSKKSTNGSFLNPIDVEGSSRAPESANSAELCSTNAKEEVSNLTVAHELLPPISIATQALPVEQENIVKRESHLSPKKSRQASMMPYRTLNSMVAEDSGQIPSPPRNLRSRNVISMPFKQRIHKEQHTADLHAVQILS